VRRIFGPTKDGVTRKWRRLHNEELYDLYSSLNIIQLIKLKRMRWASLVACMRYRRGACMVLVGKPWGRRPHGGIELKWIFKKWSGGMDLIVLAQYRDRWQAIVNALMNLQVLSNVGNFLTSSVQVSFSRILAPWSMKYQLVLCGLLFTTTHCILKNNAHKSFP
jgi:hypothetical protein